MVETTTSLDAKGVKNAPMGPDPVYKKMVEDTKNGIYDL